MNDAQHGEEVKYDNPEEAVEGLEEALDEYQQAEREYYRWVGLQQILIGVAIGLVAGMAYYHFVIL